MHAYAVSFVSTEQIVYGFTLLVCRACARMPSTCWSLCLTSGSVRRSFQALDLVHQ